MIVMYCMCTVWVCHSSLLPSQGEGGPSGPTGAAGARGAPVSYISPPPVSYGPFLDLY